MLANAARLILQHDTPNRLTRHASFLYAPRLLNPHKSKLFPFLLCYTEKKA